jgi:hypothetical protein
MQSANHYWLGVLLIINGPIDDFNSNLVITLTNLPVFRKRQQVSGGQL